MEEKLKWLSENMPDEWVLTHCKEDVWYLRDNGKPGDYLIPWGEGDIGLAPLTALLKQSLYSDTYLLAVNRTARHKFFVSQVPPAPEFDTEFEAVLAAYKSCRD